MKKILFVFILSLLFSIVKAQVEFTKKGDKFYKKGDYQNAIISYQKAKDGFNKTKKNDPVSYGTACYNLANGYFAIANYEEAKKYYIEAGDFYIKKLGDNHPYYGMICNALGSLFSYQNNYKKSFYFYKKAEIIFKDLPEEADNYAYTCNGLASLYGETYENKSSDYQKAEEYYLISQELYEKTTGKESSDYAWILFSLSRLYEIQGKFQKAEKLIKQGSEIYEKTTGKNHHNYAMACKSLADLYHRQNNYLLSENKYIEAKKIYQNTLGEIHPNYLDNLNCLADLYLNQGKYLEAEDTYLQSIKINKETNQKNTLIYFYSCNGLAGLYFLEGKYNESEKIYLEAQLIIKSIFKGINNTHYATNLNNLALLYQAQKKYTKAEKLYLEAQGIFLKIWGNQALDYSIILNNLGLFYNHIKEYKKSLSFYEKAKKLDLKYKGKNHKDYAVVCHNMAGLFDDLQEYKKAEKYYIEAKEIRENLLGTNHPHYARTCHHFAVCYKKQHKYVEAEPLYKIALKSKLTEIHTLLPTLSERERLAYFQSIHFYFDTFYDFVFNYQKQQLIDDLFNIQLEVKGLIFQSTQEMQNQILKSNNDDLIEKYFAWKEKKALYNTYHLMSIEEQKKNNINLDSLDKVINETEKILSKQSILFSKNNKIYTWKNIQQKLQKDEAAIDIIRTDSVYLALILEKNKNPQLVFIDSTHNIENQIHYYKNCIKYEIEDTLSYHIFWKPIKDKLNNNQKIFLANDGTYHEVNLLTLKNAKTSKYLLEEVNIQLVSNLKDLMYLSEEEQANKYNNYKIHIVAYPQYKNGETSNNNSKQKRDFHLHQKLKTDTSQRFFERGGEISMLPGTHIEAEKISNLCDSLHISVEVKELKAASEEYVKSLKSPSILHIATHGFFLAQENEENTVYQDPLLRSGLLLANAEQGLEGNTIEGQEDGILTAKEALTLQLDNTDLVIMSACETGLGDIKYGEGVYGLQRAFQQAGAKTIIISLWKVSDDATQELMNYFYHNLLEKKMEKRIAFKQAQLSLMKKYPHPFFWGAFVMIGK